MAGAIPYAGAATVGASALGSIAQGYSTSAADKANAKIAEQNAGIATQNATFAAEEGEQTASVQGQKTRQTAGAQKAGMGASGISANIGSNVDVQAGTAMKGQLDMMQIRSQAARQAYGFETKAVDFQNQVAIDKSAGKNAITEGYIGGISGAGREGLLLNQAGAFDPWKTSQNNNSLQGGDSNNASGGEGIG